MKKSIIDRLEELLLSIDEDVLQDQILCEKIKCSILGILPELGLYNNVIGIYYKEENTIITSAIKSISKIDKDVYIRLAVLFADLGIEGADYINGEVENFLWKVSRRSEDLSREFLRKLGYKDEVAVYISKIILYRNLKVTNENDITRIKNKYGQRILKDISRIIKNDIKIMKDEVVVYRIYQREVLDKTIKGFDDEQEILRLKDLDVSIKELEHSNINKNKDLQKLIYSLLDLVNCDRELNKKNILLGIAKNL